MRVLGFVLALLAWMLAATVALAEEGRWQELENNPACFVWNPYPQEQETVTWSGACADRTAQGTGTLVWRFFEDREWKESRYEGDWREDRLLGTSRGWSNGRVMKCYLDGNTITFTD